MAQIKNHLNDLAIFLQLALNQIGLNLDDKPVIVEGISNKSDFDALDKFPLLQCYPTSFADNGSYSVTSVEIRYFFTNFTDQYLAPDRLRWVGQKQIPPLIRAFYSDAQESCGEILDDSDITGSFGLGYYQAKTMPVVVIKFKIRS
jgi:hypothetical protein